MNVFVYELERNQISGSDQKKLLKVEDNIGESIHIHYGDIRLDYSIDEFDMLTKELLNAKEELNNGNN